MVVVLFLLALAMVGTGIAAMVFGAPIIQVERGWTMVMAGATAASAGAVLIGVATVAQRLGRVARAIRLLAERPAAVAVASEEPPRAPIGPDRRLLDGDVIGPDGSEPLPDGGASDQAIVGRYASGGNAYTMYADGSIVADMPGGRRRFGSLDELKSFVAAGG